ncbi:MAG TPA: hydrogenase maturation protease [Gaiellaceae bacterium]|nr:hydrogenase maturation protease [Gaiellaceae bacterium]
MRDPLPEARGRAVVIGVGNAWRNDDGAGLAVARLLDRRLPGVEVLEREGEPTSLIDAWEGAEAVWLADAVSSGAAPGTVHRHDASSEPLPARLYDTSTHHFGLGEAVELARALGRLPGHVVVYGIEGGSFDTGETLSAVVQEAAARVAEAIAEEVAGCTRRR